MGTRPRLGVAWERDQSWGISMGMRPKLGDKYGNQTKAGSKYGNETKQGDIMVYNDKQHIQQ